MEASDSLMSKEYAGWLENVIGEILKADPKKIAIAFRSGDDEEVYTEYFGCNVEDMAVFAHYMNSDAMMNTVLANADKVVREAERMEDSDESN